MFSLDGASIGLARLITERDLYAYQHLWKYSMMEARPLSMGSSVSAVGWRCVLSMMTERIVFEWQDYFMDRMFW